MARTKASKPLKNAGDAKLKVEPRPIVPNELRKPKSRTFKRWRPGTVAVRDIRREQKKTTFAVPKAAFVRVVQELVHNVAPSSGVRISQPVYAMLQAAVEDFGIDLFKRAQLMAIDNHHITVMPQHIKRAAQVEQEIRTRIVSTQRG